MHGVEQHSGVLDRLGESIASGARAPGTVLTLAGLEEEFAVSRTLVREVVRVLESMGMVESRRRVGVTVRPPRDWNPFDPRLIRWRLGGPGRDEQLRSLTELRTAIEPVAAPGRRPRRAEVPLIGRDAEVGLLRAAVHVLQLLLHVVVQRGLVALRRRQHVHPAP